MADLHNQPLVTLGDILKAALDVTCWRAAELAALEGERR